MNEENNKNEYCTGGYVDNDKKYLVGINNGCLFDLSYDTLSIIKDNFLIKNKVGYEVIEEAFKHIGTPWIHQAQLEGVGFDCAQFILFCYKKVGVDLSKFAWESYDRIPDGTLLKKTCSEAAQEININELENGDFILIAYERAPQHLGFYYKDENGEEFIIHSYMDQYRNGVEKKRLGSWKRKIRGAFRVYY